MESSHLSLDNSSPMNTNENENKKIENECVTNGHAQQKQLLPQCLRKPNDIDHSSNETEKVDVTLSKLDLHGKLTSDISSTMFNADGVPDTGNGKALTQSTGISYTAYKSEVDMPPIMKLITNGLSEPYSIYTYRYFLHNWPHLSFLVSNSTII